MHSTERYLKRYVFPNIKREKLNTLQVNLGYKCNQNCFHCHVNASPKRKELMNLSIIKEIIIFIKKNNINTLDLTGGAPELNPNFKYLIREVSKLKIKIIDRCNLTILLEKNMEDLAEFLAYHQVEITASLPCYLEKNVDNQRGSGIFKKSIIALKKLNDLGYGKKNNLILNLVYNPQDDNLPPPQQELEKDYKEILWTNYKIVFDNLFTLANMPIKRFGSTLISKNKFDKYMDTLQNSFNKENLNNLMCKNLISIDWQGFVYDCDFNQMLNIPLQIKKKGKIFIKDINKKTINKNNIQVSGHCFGCTAGQGSSCGGALGIQK